MIQLHTVPIIRTDLCAASGREIVEIPILTLEGAEYVGVSHPTIRAERMCTSQIHQHSLLSGKITAPMPKINDGPALLQKESILSASLRDKFPAQYT